MKLHEYQEKAINHIESCNNPILSIGCGLGKTAAVLHYIERNKPASVLIVAPKRVAETVWKQEAEKWGLKWIAEKLTIVAGPKAKRAKLIQSSNYLVIGRDNLEDVRGMQFVTLVMDELTSFKNHSSKRTDAICSIHAQQRIGLTGTFLTNGAIDCFGQFVAVGLGGRMTKRERTNTFYRWRATYFRDALAGSGLQFQKWQLVVPLDHLIKKVKDNIFTLDSKDWLEIPKVQYFEHYVDLNDSEMEEYIKLNSMLNCELGGEIVSFSENQKFAKLQTLCNGFVYDDGGEAIRSEHSTKLDEVVEFVDRCISEGEQVLLFYAFKEEKVWLEEKLKKNGAKIGCPTDKNWFENWNNRTTDVLMAHPASLGHGVSLHYNNSRIIVWSSITYDAELYYQANARLMRQGQKNGVQVHIFMAKNTVEIKKLKAIKNKNKILEEFINLTK